MERTYTSGADVGGDETTLAFLYNQDDLGPAVRLAFEERKETAFVDKIDQFIQKRNTQIMEICSENYQEFITSVDQLFAVKSDTMLLAEAISRQNQSLQESGIVLIQESENLIRQQIIQRNITSVQKIMRLFLHAINLCVETKSLVDSRRLPDAFKAIEQLEKDLLPKLAQFTVARSLAEVYIPKLKDEIKSRASKDFLDWLIKARESSRSIGKNVMNQVLTMQKILRNANKDNESDALEATVEAFHKHMEANILEQQSLDLTVVHHCVYIYTNLNAIDEFRALYRDNRKSQAQIIMQPMNMNTFMPNYQTYLETILGFFVIEDEILKSTEGLMSYIMADSIWDTFNSRLIAILRESLPNCQKHDVLLHMKTSVFAFCRAMLNYGYKVRTIVDILDASQDKYGDMIATELQRDIAKIFLEDKFEAFSVNSTKEYDKLIASFNLDADEGVPNRFPKTFPFSRMVPYICVVIQTYVKDALRYTSQETDLGETIRKATDRFISNYVCKGLADIVAKDYRQQQLSQIAQIYLNCQTFGDRVCSFFEETHLRDRHSTIPSRLNNSRRSFRETQFKAEQAIVYCIQKKTDEFFMLAEDVEWWLNSFDSFNLFLFFLNFVDLFHILQTIIYFSLLFSTPSISHSFRDPVVVSGTPHDFLDDLCTYVATAFISLSFFDSTVQEAICVQVFKHLQSLLMKIFLSPNVRAYTLQGVHNFLEDVSALEQLAVRLSFPALKDSFTESRQYGTLLLYSGDILSEFHSSSSKYPKVEFNHLNSVVSRMIVKAPEVGNSSRDSIRQSKRSSKPFSKFFGSK